MLQQKKSLVQLLDIKFTNTTLSVYNVITFLSSNLMKYGPTDWNTKLALSSQIGCGQISNIVATFNPQR